MLERDQLWVTRPSVCLSVRPSVTQCIHSKLVTVRSCVAYTAACYSRYTAARQLPASWFGRVPAANEYMRGALLL